MTGVVSNTHAPKLGAMNEQRRLQLLEPQAIDERAVRRAQVD